MLPDRVWIDPPSECDNWPYRDLQQRGPSLMEFYVKLREMLGITDAARGTDLKKWAGEEAAICDRLGLPFITTHWIGCVTHGGLKLSKSVAEWTDPVLLARRHGTTRLWRVLAASLTDAPVDFMAVTPHELAREIALPFHDRDIELDPLLRQL